MYVWCLLTNSQVLAPFHPDIVTYGSSMETNVAQMAQTAQAQM